MTLKLAGIDFGNLIPSITEKVKEAEGRALGGADKERWVIQQLESTLEGLLEQALPMFRPIIKPVLDFAVPFAVKVCWHALFGPDAGLP